MEKYFAILRGINVGGHRKILMKDLKILFKKQGFKNAVSYIQSGNVIFEAKYEKNIPEIENTITSAIKKQFGFDVPVIVRKTKELKMILNSNPFLKNDNHDPEKLAVTFLNKFPDKESVKLVEQFDFSPDKFKIVDNNIFILLAGKYSDSKLTNQFFENKLNLKSTTRNWKTINKLFEIADK
mgnify:CR=1 FL=1